MPLTEMLLELYPIFLSPLKFALYRYVNTALFEIQEKFIEIQ